MEKEVKTPHREVTLIDDSINVKGSSIKQELSGFETAEEKVEYAQTVIHYVEEQVREHLKALEEVFKAQRNMCALFDVSLAVSFSEFGKPALQAVFGNGKVALKGAEDLVSDIKNQLES